MTFVHEKEFAANVLPTTLGQGNYPGAASTRKGRRPTTAPSSTSPAWFSRGKSDWERRRGWSTDREIEGKKHSAFHAEWHWLACQGVVRNALFDVDIVCPASLSAPPRQSSFSTAFRTKTGRDDPGLRPGRLPSTPTGSRKIVDLWSGRLDLNQRLPRPERGTLPD